MNKIKHPGRAKNLSNLICMDGRIETYLNIKGSKRSYSNSTIKLWSPTTWINLAYKEKYIKLNDTYISKSS